MIDRRAFRAHPLDGAQLYFQPATGVHVRIARAATRGLRRAAPRVAMFGITNACNLACEFCSRDARRPSAWTVATAAAALRGLHDAGTLEVAYGGGEPFAFRGFAELVAELDATTALAQHVTTNGTLISAATWPRFAGRFGQVRISIYDDGWRAAAAVLADHGQRWGANVLVDAAALDALPARLAALAAAGCHDTSLLSYVGPDAGRHLDAAGDRRLAAIVADSPVACRLSVCFGDRVAAPRLYGDGDCGAGRDFVSITPDQRVQSCSFQDRSTPATTAAEILAVWRTQQVALAAPSPRRGCARALPQLAEPPAMPPIAIWRSFSGNNSGECVLVATFRALADAEAYLAALAPGWIPDGRYSPAWRQLFADEGVAAPDVDARSDDASPRELVAIGRTVIAAQYAADDAFPELRALAWKRGGYVVPGGVHVHDPLTLVFAIRCDDDRDREARLAVARAELGSHACFRAHGETIVAAIPVLGTAFETLAEARDAVIGFAGARPLAAELFSDAVTDAQLVHAAQRLGHTPDEVARLAVTFWGRGDDAAARFAQLIGDRATLAGSTVLVEPTPDRKRLAVLACRHGGVVDALDGARVQLDATIWHDDPPAQKGTRAEPRVLDLDALEAALRATLPPAAELAIEPPHERAWRRHPSITITTDAPAAALTALAGGARTAGAHLGVRIADLDPLPAALRRLIADLRR